MPEKTRALPRPFSLHWGSGRIVEEATYVGEHHEPSLQLLELDDALPAGGQGSLSVRFCYYDHGRLQRSPLIVSKDEAPGLRKALAAGPRLKAFLQEMIG